jgi:hypothetical protein
MSLFSAIGHFFASLFPGHGDAAQKVLHSVSSFVSLAVPIVAAIDQELKTVAPASSEAAAVERFLARYEPDLEKVKGVAAQLAALPSADLWHDLAVYALSTLAPAGTAQSLLRLAVELAYNLQKAQPALTPAA